jgi:hypothetical protein
VPAAVGRRPGAGQSRSCSAPPSPPTRVRCWPGSFGTWGWTGPRSRSSRRNGRHSSGPGWRANGCSSCWTTRATRRRCGRCFRAARRARCWSPPAGGCPSWWGVGSLTWTCFRPARRALCSAGSPARSARARNPPRPMRCSRRARACRWRSGSPVPGWPLGAAGTCTRSRAGSPTNGGGWTNCRPGTWRCGRPSR